MVPTHHIVLAPLQDLVISSLTVQNDLPVLILYNHTHPLPITIELQYVEHLVLHLLSPDLHNVL